MSGFSPCTPVSSIEGCRVVSCRIIACYVVAYSVIADQYLVLCCVVLALAMSVVLHQVVIVLKRKTSRVPLRAVIIRSIEFVGRIFVAPISFLYYMLTFMNPTILIYSVFAFSLLLFMVLIGTREWGGLKKSLVVASNSIQDKLDEGEKTSKTEMFVMNVVSFKSFSIDTKHYKARLSRRERRQSEQRRNIEMRARSKSQAGIDSDDEED